MPQDALVLVNSGYNRYSLAVLTGIVEEDPRLQNLAIHVVKNRKKKQTPLLSNRELAEHLIELARQYDKMVVGFSFHTASVIEIAATIDVLRNSVVTNRIEHVLLVAGGPHPSGDPRGTLQLGFDVVVVGEGENTFPNLLVRYLDKKPYSDLKGLSFFDSVGNYTYTGCPEPADLNCFPPFAVEHDRYCPLEISRGCPWGCLYCQTPFLMGHDMRHRSIDNIFMHVERMKSKGKAVLRFIAPSAFAYGSKDGKTVNLEALEEMLKAVSTLFTRDQIYLGSFPSEVRPEQVSSDALELVKTYCSNRNLVIGAQSGSDALLHAIRRGHGVEDIIRATELTLTAGLLPSVDFIFGLPGEAQQDRDATLALMKHLLDMGARLHCHTFMPLVGTPFAQSRPGQVDEQTRRFLDQLRGKRLEHGRWKQQEQLAQTTRTFLAHQKHLA